ncbi:MAG: hypothetical protein ACRCVJ_01410 [Clostridium sp.]|uniref:hypothetical protein n=1 Tax=Clostridium sp. TaxID=1506 RepID=UPI003F3D1866
MKKSYLIYTLLISIFIIQSAIFIENSKLESKSKEVLSTNMKSDKIQGNKKQINEVFDELNNFNNIEIKNIDFNEDKVKADIDIIGSKKDIEYVIENLSDYSISKYNVMYENGIFNINVCLE